jgi:NAD(P)H-flavin reductase
VQTFLASVVRLRDLTHDVREIELHLDESPDIAFAAGQFLSFLDPDPRTAPIR